MRENIWQIWNSGKPGTPQELLHPIARIAFPHSGNGRIDSNHQCGKTCAASPVNRPFGGFASPEQIQLIPTRTLRRRFHVLQFVTGDRGKNVPDTCLSSRASCGHFAVGMHQATVTNRGQHCREGKLMAQYVSLHVAIADRHCAARTKQYIAKYATVFC